MSSVLATVLLDVFLGTLFMYYWKAKFELYPGYFYFAVGAFSYAAAIATAIVPQYEMAIGIFFCGIVFIMVTDITWAELESKNFSLYLAIFISTAVILAASIFIFVAAR